MRRKGLVAQDLKIETRNKRLQQSKDALHKATQRLIASQILANNHPDNLKHQDAMKRASTACDRARGTYSKAIRESESVIGTGTGKVGLLLPRIND